MHLNCKRVFAMLAALTVNVPAIGQETSTDSSSQATNQAINQATGQANPQATSPTVPGGAPNNVTIIPAHPDAIGGGNPFQGLGRPDDTGPARWQQFVPNSDPSQAGTSDAAALKSSTASEAATKGAAEAVRVPGSAFNIEEPKPKVESQKVSTGASPEKDSPMRRALLAIHRGLYAEALDRLRAIASENKMDPQVHYLMAVTHVMLRQYNEATQEYQLTEKLAEPGSSMAMLAEQGLHKLTYEDAVAYPGH